MKAMLYKILMVKVKTDCETHSTTGVNEVRMKFELYKRSSNLEKKTNLTSPVMDLSLCYGFFPVCHYWASGHL